MRLIIYFMILFTPLTSFAFSWKKCSSQGLGSLDIFGLTTSTGQFMTSTGGCSMLGKNEHDKKVFIASTFEQIQTEAAKGNGEYLRALSSLYGCDKEGMNHFGPTLQKNFLEVFDNFESGPKEFYHNLNKLMNRDADLKRHCKSSQV